VNGRRFTNDNEAFFEEAFFGRKGGWRTRVDLPLKSVIK